MCNPGYYDYRSRGLANEWLPFGVVIQVTNAVDIESLTKCLQKEDLAFSQGEDGKFRLMMCPSLRRLLQDVAKCHVVETFECRVTHAQLVAQGAKELMEGRNEGVLDTNIRRLSSVSSWGFIVCFIPAVPRYMMIL